MSSVICSWKQIINGKFINTFFKNCQKTNLHNLNEAMTYNFEPSAGKPEKQAKLSKPQASRFHRGWAFSRTIPDESPAFFRRFSFCYLITRGNVHLLCVPTVTRESYSVFWGLCRLSEEPEICYFHIYKLGTDKTVLLPLKRLSRACDRQAPLLSRAS